eukprot:TRINITY_DN67865_c7_g1_i1.p1 TRINITY_DN67865_c7_g1~~TRINITY_DN67865_c7_g1_i1.p1  ORF type:complete len:531 (+),score=33.52 TRINITY_DN67865_c7_g1_i1:40-1632(+)
MSGRRGTKGNDALGYIMKRFSHERTNKSSKRKARRIWWSLIALGRMRRSTRMCLEKEEEITCHELYDKHSDQMRSADGIFAVLSEIGITVTQDDVESLLNDLRYFDGPVIPFETWKKVLETLKKRWQDTTMADTVELFIALGGSTDCSGGVPLQTLQSTMEVFDLPLPSVEGTPPVTNFQLRSSSVEEPVGYQFGLSDDDFGQPERKDRTELDYSQLLTLVADEDNPNLVRLVKAKKEEAQLRNHRKSRVQFGSIVERTSDPGDRFGPSRRGSMIPISQSGKELAAHKVATATRGKELLNQLEDKARKMGPIWRAKCSQHQYYGGNPNYNAASNHNNGRGRHAAADSAYSPSYRSSSPSLRGAAGRRKKHVAPPMGVDEEERIERLYTKAVQQQQEARQHAPRDLPLYPKYQDKGYLTATRPKSQYLTLRSEVDTNIHAHELGGRPPSKRLVSPRNNKVLQLLPPEFRRPHTEQTFSQTVPLRPISSHNAALPAIASPGRAAVHQSKRSAYISSLATDLLVHMSPQYGPQ